MFNGSSGGGGKVFFFGKARDSLVPFAEVQRANQMRRYTGLVNVQRRFRMRRWLGTTEGSQTFASHLFRTNLIATGKHPHGIGTIIDAFDHILEMGIPELRALRAPTTFFQRLRRLGISDPLSAIHRNRGRLLPSGRRFDLLSPFYSTRHYSLMNYASDLQQAARTQLGRNVQDLHQPNLLRRSSVGVDRTRFRYPQIPTNRVQNARMMLLDVRAHGTAEQQATGKLTLARHYNASHLMPGDIPRATSLYQLVHQYDIVQQSQGGNFSARALSYVQGLEQRHGSLQSLGFGINRERMPLTRILSDGTEDVITPGQVFSTALERLDPTRMKELSEYVGEVPKFNDPYGEGDFGEKSMFQKGKENLDKKRPLKKQKTGHLQWFHPSDLGGGGGFGGGGGGGMGGGGFGGGGGMGGGGGGIAV
jgi:hypothetical protein